MNPDLLLVHYHEIGLKGRNRPMFEKALKRNLKVALGDQASAVAILPGRLEVRDPGPGAVEIARRVFGVANVAPAKVAGADLDEIVGTALEVAKAADVETGFATFAVRARKARTSFDVSSQRVNEVVGDAIRTGLGKQVNLSAPEVTVRIEVLQSWAYVSAHKLSGPGGLPVGTAGVVVSMLSGGIDSPVATWQLMKRGGDPVAVHFHAAPFTDRSSQQKVEKLIGVLGTWGYRRHWWSVPLGEAQREISLTADSPYRLLLYRRLMVRIAEAVGRDEGALGLVTGESLGQVASQTLENMAAVGAVATLPVLRPLVGSDKTDIIELAERIGTYDTSAESHQDCCTLFEPRDPATRATAEELDAQESRYDVAGMVEACVAAAERRPSPGS